jgi:hypothetical protein
MNKELIKTIFNLGYHFGIDTERSQVFIKEQRNHKTPHLLNLIDWEAERVLKFLEDLNIEERELSKEERVALIQPYGMDALIPKAREEWMKRNNIPTKLITVTYKREKKEIYE